MNSPRKAVNPYHSQILKRPRRLNVRQSLLQILQLRIHLALGLLGTLHSLRLKGLDRLDLSRYIHLLDRERIELLLNVRDDVLVLQLRAVVGEVDGLRLLGQHLHSAARIVIALLEGG